jgi:hydroxyacylglutathione hydrolase
VIFTQYYLECLSQASYLIGDETTGRAVVVDPRRDAAEYIRDADESNMQIEMIIETHFHADFLSGHLELAAATGAVIGFSSVADTDFDSVALEHGTRLSLGEVQLEFRHTPGHTPESLSIVVWEHADDDVPYAVLTGDTLFIGDVGRPDLLSSVGRTSHELAGMLYDSLHEQLLTLPDATRVYPAHGAGSACGKNLSADTWSTIGEQRATNYALQALDKAAFVELVTEGQPPAPAYFAYDAALNRQAHQLLDETEPPTSLTLDELDQHVAAGAVVVDARDPEEFAQGHLNGSINIGLNGRYAEFAGSVVAPDVDVVLVTQPGFETEAKNRLARIGFDRVVGHLADPLAVMSEHPGRVRHASRLSAAQFDDIRGDIRALQVIDIRNPGEVALGLIENATTIPVGQLRARMSELDPTASTVVYCAGGYRSSVAASLLRTQGFTDVSDIIGGFGAWIEHRRTEPTNG